MWRLVYFGLRREKDEAKRFKLLRDALAKCDAVLLPLDIIYSKRRSHEKDSQGFSYLVNEAKLEELKRSVLHTVRIWAKDGRLRRHPRADEALFWWEALASLEEVRAWLNTQLTTGANAAWALTLM